MNWSAVSKPLILRRKRYIACAHFKQIKTIDFTIVPFFFERKVKRLLYY